MADSHDVGMNNPSFFGRIDSEPQLTGMPGRDVLKFWLKVHGRRDKFPLYLEVLTFRELAVRLADEVEQGDMVAVSGHLRSDVVPGRRREYRHSMMGREVEAVKQLEDV
jgi:single-stranded DNA-binding protein